MSMLLCECARTVLNSIILDFLLVFIIDFAAGKLNFGRLAHIDAHLVKFAYLLPNHMWHILVRLRHFPFIKRNFLSLLRKIVMLLLVIMIAVTRCLSSKLILTVIFVGVSLLTPISSHI